MRERTDTRARILAIAERHLMRRGYNAFSFQDIAAELGVKSAAIHYHFPTKTALVVAAIEHYGALFEAWVDSTADWTAAERLMGYFEIGRLVAADGRVCPLSMAVAQLEAIPDEVQAAVRVVHQRILAFYVQNLAEARSAGAVRFEGSPEDQGSLLGSALIGAQLAARIYGLDAFKRVMRQQARALGLPERWPRVALPPAEGAPQRAGAR